MGKLLIIFLLLAITATTLFFGKTTIDKTGIHMERPLTACLYVCLIVAYFYEEIIRKLPPNE